MENDNREKISNREIKKENDSSTGQKIWDISEFLSRKETFPFLIYLNFISSLSNHLENKKENPSSLIGDVIISQDFKRIECGKCKDMEKLGCVLRNAWLTEIQMTVIAQNDKFVSYLNHWLSVQAYYSIYAELLAYILASGQNYFHNHIKNLDTMSDKIDKKSNLFPFPWRVICKGNPTSSSFKLLNLPQNVELDWSADMRSSSSSFWDLYVKFLKRTRMQRFNTKCQEWRSKNTNRMDRFIKEDICGKIPPTTIFNCLYRLRLHSNYKDADIFLKSFHNTDQAKQFRFSLLNISWCTLFVLELLIARYIGKKHFNEFVDDFRKFENTGISNELIYRRWEILQSLF